MAADRYFILEQDAELADAIPGSGLKGFGVSPMGAPKPATPPAVKVTKAELSPNEAASERKREGVRMVGLAMPIGLIKPLNESTIAVATDKVGWGIEATGADKTGLDGQDVTVAVLDTGIKADHPAFAGMTLDQADFTEDGDAAPDLHGHGTHCAGTIFGRDVDGVRIGVARGVQRALIAKVIPDDRPGDSAMLFDALNWASREGANIVSMSLGFDFPGLVKKLVEVHGLPQELAVSNALVVFSQNLRAFDTLMAAFRAAESFGRNMLVVAAAGNESQRDAATSFRISASLPAAATGVVSVAAYGRKGAGFSIAPFSNSDPQIAAPGVDVISAGLADKFAEMSGTSQACPHVAGLAALWWQKLKQDGETPTPDRVREQILATATTTKFPKDTGEVDRGRGRAQAPG
jgi:subtilisin family serine protease